MHFTSAIILACTFYPISAYVSFVCVYFLFFRLPVGDCYVFYKRGGFYRRYLQCKKQTCFYACFLLTASVLLAV